MIKELLGKVFAKIEFMNHVNFSGDISAALAAPFTELASWDLHTPDTKQFLTLQAGLIDKIHELSPKVLHKGGWGTALENERKVFICLGWDDLAVRIFNFMKYDAADNSYAGVQSVHWRHPGAPEHRRSDETAGGRNAFLCYAQEVRDEISTEGLEW